MGDKATRDGFGGRPVVISGARPLEQKRAYSSD